MSERRSHVEELGKLGYNVLSIEDLARIEKEPLLGPDEEGRLCWFGVVPNALSQGFNVGGIEFSQFATRSIYDGAGASGEAADGYVGVIQWLRRDQIERFAKDAPRHHIELTVCADGPQKSARWRSFTTATNRMRELARQILSARSGGSRPLGATPEEISMISGLELEMDVCPQNFAQICSAPGDSVDREGVVKATNFVYLALLPKTGASLEMHRYSRPAGYDMVPVTLRRSQEISHAIPRRCPPTLSAFSEKERRAYERYISVLDEHARRQHLEDDDSFLGEVYRAARASWVAIA